MKLCLDIVLHDSNLKRPQIVEAAPLKFAAIQGYLNAKYFTTKAKAQHKKNVGGQKKP